MVGSASCAPFNQFHGHDTAESVREVKMTVTVKEELCEQRESGGTDVPVNASYHVSDEPEFPSSGGMKDGRKACAPPLISCLKKSSGRYSSSMPVKREDNHTYASGDVSCADIDETVSHETSGCGEQSGAGNSLLRGDHVLSSDASPANSHSLDSDQPGSSLVSKEDDDAPSDMGPVVNGHGLNSHQQGHTSNGVSDIGAKSTLFQRRCALSDTCPANDRHGLDSGNQGHASNGVPSKIHPCDNASGENNMSAKTGKTKNEAVSLISDGINEKIALVNINKQKRNLVGILSQEKKITIIAYVASKGKDGANMADIERHVKGFGSHLSGVSTHAVFQYYLSEQLEVRTINGTKRYFVTPNNVQKSASVARAVPTSEQGEERSTSSGQANNQKKKLMVLSDEMKSRIIAFAASKGNDGASMPDFQCCVKGFQSSCNGLSSHAVLEASLSEELVLRTTNGTKRYFPKPKTKGSLIVARAVLTLNASQQDNRSNTPKKKLPVLSDEMKAKIVAFTASKGNDGASMPDFERCVKGFQSSCNGLSPHAVFEASLSEELVLRTTNGTKRYFTTPKIYDQKKKLPVLANEMKAKIVAFAASKGNDGASMPDFERCVKGFQSSFYGVSSHTVLEANLSEELVVRTINGSKRYFVTPNTKRKRSPNNMNIIMGSAKKKRKSVPVPTLAVGSGSDGKISTRMENYQEHRIQLTREQASDTKFPPGCQVIYHYKCCSDKDVVRIKLGVVVSACVSLGGNFMFKIKRSRSNDGVGEEALVREDSLAYVPNTRVHFQPRTINSSLKEGIVLLAQLSDSNRSKFLYSVMTTSDDGSSDIIYNNVEAAQLFFRAISEAQPASENKSAVSGVVLGDNESESRLSGHEVVTKRSGDSHKMNGSDAKRRRLLGDDASAISQP